MNNKTGSTGILKLTAGADKVGGVAEIVGSIFGVIVADELSGAEYALDTGEGGTFILPKLSTLVVSVGDQLYWDVADEEFNASSTGNWAVGKAVAAAGNGDLTVEVRIQQADAVSA